MPRRVLFFILFLGLALSVVFVPRQNVARVVGLPNFTIPTRTPVPSPTTEQPTTQPPTAVPTAVPPTAVPPTTEPPTAVPPTLTSPPSSTNTPLPSATPLSQATPIGGLLPTAIACGVPPTLQVQSNARVRFGPGTDYAIVAELLARDVRVIIGRAANAPWWLVDLGNGQSGWVADSIVRVQGYTGSVPIVVAPPLNGQTPTPGPLWQPTVAPNCTVTPLPTTTPTPTASATATPNPTNTKTAVDPATANTAPGNDPTATATSVVPTAEALAVTLAETEAEPAATAVPLDPPTTNAAALPCASAMIGLAAVGFVVGRRFW
jgi:hypothetical protein